jgi:hypothetical protein
VDLLVVGTVGLAALSPLLDSVEERLGREVNPTVYTRAEFTEKLDAGHHFLSEVVDGPKLFVFGGADDLG